MPTDSPCGDKQLENVIPDHKGTRNHSQNACDRKLDDALKCIGKSTVPIIYLLLFFNEIIWCIQTPLLFLLFCTDTGSANGPTKTGCNALMDGVLGIAAATIKDYGLDPLTEKSVQGIADTFKVAQLNELVQKALDGIEWKVLKWKAVGVSNSQY